MATRTVEDYVKRIDLEQQGDPGARVPTGPIAQALPVTPGTATAMIKTLADSGLVDHEPYAGVRLTDAGIELATRVIRFRRRAESSSQRADFLRLVESHGLMPGRRVVVRSRDELLDTVEVIPDLGSPLRPGFRAASRILVAPESGDRPSTGRGD